jgi:hypothetical protein
MAGLQWGAAEGVERLLGGRQRVAIEHVEHAGLGAEDQLARVGISNGPLEPSSQSLRSMDWKMLPSGWYGRPSK